MTALSILGEFMIKQLIHSIWFQAGALFVAFVISLLAGYLLVFTIQFFRDIVPHGVMW